MILLAAVLYLAIGLAVMFRALQEPSRRDFWSDCDTPRGALASVLALTVCAGLWPLLLGWAVYAAGAKKRMPRRFDVRLRDGKVEIEEEGR